MLSMLAALLLAAQDPQAAQPSGNPPPADQEIVVTGHGPVTVPEAREHVNAISTTREGQLTRFHAPICPVVIGMEPALANAVTARIRQVAAAAGVPVAPPQCAPNMGLVITPDGASFVERFRRARPRMFSALPRREVRLLLDRSQPVRAWTNTDIFNEEGMAAGGSRGEPARTMRVYTASIIRESTQLATLNSVVVINDAAADGKSLAQLADYAVMRTLAGARRPQSGDFNRGTILSLFDTGGGEPAATLTDMDAAYLAALYRSNSLQTSMRQLAEMSRLITRELERGGPSEQAPAPD